MLDFIAAGPNLPFSVALALVLIIALLEGVGLLLGFGFLRLLDQLTPGIDLGVEAPDLDGGGSGLSARLLGWLHFGKVPALVLLVLFLTAFGGTGLILQALVNSVTGSLLPGSLASVIALPPALGWVRIGGRLLARLLPGDHSEAVSEASFIGRVATVTLGTARFDSPAQAKLRDQYRQTHYVMIAPDQPDDVFPAGTRALIVRQEGSLYRAIPNPHPVLAE